MAIFGYTAMTLVKFFKRSKQGKCGGCKTGCDCNTIPTSNKNQLNIPHIKS